MTYVPSRPIARGIRSQTLFALVIASTVAGLFVINLPAYPNNEIWPRVFGLVVIVVLAGATVRSIVREQGTIELNPFSPGDFYLLFFGIYYLLPFLLVVIDPDLQGVDYFRLGCAISLGFVAFRLGCNAVRKKTRYLIYAPGTNAARALVFISCCCILAVGSFFLWRLRNGNFYTHASSYTVGTDTASSLYESFVLFLQFPIIFLLGIVASSPGRYATLARAILIPYVVGLFLIFVATSQFRFALEVLLFSWLAQRMYGPYTLPLKTGLRLSAIALAALVLIFTIRESGANTELAGSENQLVDLVKGVVNGSLLDPSSAAYATLGSSDRGTRLRAVSPLLFLNEVMLALDEPAARFGKGHSLLYELKEIVPRAVWPGKPDFFSTQIYIRQDLGMKEIDSSPHPLLQFYYELGWAGIIGGFFVFGFFLEYLAGRQKSAFPFFLFAFIWPAIAQVEVGLFLNLLSVVRAALILYFAWRLTSAWLDKGSEPDLGKFRISLGKQRIQS